MPYTVAGIPSIANPQIIVDANGNPITPANPLPLTSTGVKSVAVAASTTDTTVKGTAGVYFGCKISVVAALAVNINDGGNTIDVIPASLGLGQLSGIPADGIQFATSLVVKGGLTNPALIVYFT